MEFTIFELMLVCSNNFSELTTWMDFHTFTIITFRDVISFHLGIHSQAFLYVSPLPNGYGVNMYSRRLWVQVPPEPMFNNCNVGLGVSKQYTIIQFILTFSNRGIYFFINYLLLHTYIWKNLYYFWYDIPYSY